MLKQMIHMRDYHANGVIIFLMILKYLRKNEDDSDF